MEQNFDHALEHVLLHEGGFVDHPDDPGGATNKGVTLATFRRFYGAASTVVDLVNITDQQLARIYQAGYWDKCHCDDLPSGVDYCVFDAAVNSGPGRSAKWLQGAVGATQDGAIGPQTLAVVTQADPDDVINGMCDARMAFLRSLRTFHVFGRGWTRRVDGVRSEALKMAGASVGHGSIDGVLPDLEFPVLRLGATGVWVTKVQEALGTTVETDFGLQTDLAVRAFQRENGLVADGIVGRVTYRALGLAG